jgi:hypothetical protein
MSNDRGYIIETVQSSSTEHGSGSVNGRITTSQAPFALRPYVARFRRGCVPYLAGPRTSLDLGLRQNCFPEDSGVTVSLPLIASSSEVFTPSISTTVTSNLTLIASSSRVFTPSISTAVTVNLPLIPSASSVFNPSISTAQTNFYTEIISASNPVNSSSMHVGSIYLDARTYTTFGALFADIGSGGNNSHVELKRFTGGSSLFTLTNTNSSFAYVTASSVTVSNTDWYDIYISASGNPATASIRGIYYEF